jgi:hypothetical protein
MTMVVDRRSEVTWAEACLDDPGLYPLFADWLEENGKAREAEAARWVVSQGRKPVHEYGGAVWTDGWMWWATFDGSKGEIGSALWERTCLATRAGRYDESKWPLESYASAVGALLDLLAVWTPEAAGGWRNYNRPASRQGQNRAELEGT